MVICMFVATVALGVSLCFVKNSYFKVALQIGMYIAIICTALSCMAYKNSFGGFSIILIVSVLPMFLTVIKSPQKQKIDEENTEISNKNAKNARIFENIAVILPNLAYPLAAIALSFCSLYLGKETAFAILAGLALGIFLTFLDFIIKKEKVENTKDYFKKFGLKTPVFLAVGLCLSNIVIVLLYSFALSNIMFALGLLLFAAYLLLKVYFDTKFNHLTYILAMFFMFLAILL